MKEKLIEELEKSGIKHNESDIIFITKDSKGRIIWLERGNDKVGLKHIVLRHAKEFEKTAGISANEIPVFLNRIIDEGKLVSDRPSKNTSSGFDRVYDYNGNYYTFIGVGSNGFIVTAFPIPKEV